jgi:hypothetical protein
MRRVFERILDEVSLLRWRLRGFATSRSKVAVIVLVLVVTLASITYWQRGSDFRASDDSGGIVPIGLEYVHQVTGERFLNALTQIPTNELEDDRAILLFSELAAANYFREPDLGQRANILLGLNLPEQELVQRIEEENGTVQWIRALERQACDNQDRSLMNGLIERAAADDGDWCAAETYAYIRRLQEKSGLDPLVLEFARSFDLLVAFGAQGQRNGQFEECNDRYDYRVFFKQCWSQWGLDRLYNEFWPDLKSQRHKPSFSAAKGKELERLRRNMRLIEIMNKPVDEWANHNFETMVNNADILLWAVPAGKVLTLPLKLGTKTARAVGATRVVRPVAVGLTIASTRARPMIHTIGEGLLRGKSVNVSRMFEQSSLAVNGRVVIKIGTGQLEAIRVAAAEAANAIDDLHRYSLTRPYVNPSIAEAILDGTRHANADVVFNYLRTGQTGNYTGSALGLASKNSYQTLINEGSLRTLVKRHGGNEAIFRQELRVIHVHEYLHHLSKTAAFPYSNKLKFSPINEGITEWLNRRIARARGYEPRNRPYNGPVEVADELFIAFQRISGQHGAQAISAAETKLSQIYFQGGGGQLLDQTLMPRIVKGSPLAREVGQAQSLSRWITTEIENGRWGKVTDYIEAYIK